MQDKLNPIQNRQTLVVLPSVSAVVDVETVFADAKMVEGADLYAKLWDGPVLVLVRAGGPEGLAFGQRYLRASLPFRIEVIRDDASDIGDWLADAAVVLASGDSFNDFDIAEHTSAPIVYVIEYTLDTRLRMLQLEQGYTLQSLKTGIWTLLSEQKRRAAFRASAGIQANGQPAFKAYGQMGRTSILYYDTRITEEQLVSAEEILTKQNAIRGRRPLRLAFSGRLEAIKGADHLIPIAKELAAREIPYTLDIFGDGSLRTTMQEAVAHAGLDNVIRIHGPVSFHDELVPQMKGHVDLFVCPHMQGDPSCTYLETLSCGVPIVGYANAAFMGVLQLGEAGVAARMGSAASAADAIKTLHIDRQRLAAMVGVAAAVGRNNTFERTFSARVDHLKEVALTTIQDRLQTN